MSRKFITAVVAAALAITGVSAAPARAAEARDVAKVIGGAALIYMIGKAVSEAREDDRERDKKKAEKKKAQQAAQWRADNSAPHLPRPYVFDRHPGQHAQPARAPRGVLPGHCLQDVRGERGQVMTRDCLRSAAVRTEALPDRCSKKLRIHGDKRRVYSAQCLSEAGWRIAGRGPQGGQGDWRGAWRRD